MSKAVMVCIFELNEGVTEEEFFKVSEKLNKEFISKQKGYISWQQFVCEDKWVDQLAWETMEDAKNFEEASQTCEVAMEYFSVINLETVEMKLYSFKKEY